MGNQKSKLRKAKLWSRDTGNVCGTEEGTHSREATGCSGAGPELHTPESTASSAASQLPPLSNCYLTLIFSRVISNAGLCRRLRLSRESRFALSKSSVILPSHPPVPGMPVTNCVPLAGLFH